MGEELDSTKARLAREICSISALFASCSHVRNSTRRLGFIDWYLILRIDEDSGSDAIRRRYRQLALQLHPDKNKHPKAEVAFKLVSEAYECLSDKARRKAFNSDRKSSFCAECHKKSQHPTAQKSHRDAAPQSKQHKIIRAFKEVQNRLKEECRVIEDCLRANESGGGTESPLFDPSDRKHFPDYPHHRTRMFEQQSRDDSWHYCSFSSSPAYRKLRCESPVYQLRSESRRGWSKSPGFRF